MNFSNKPTMTREEERKARARANQAYHLAKVKKQKDWLAAHPHVAEQQAREKEERRKNNETIRMLQAMKEETPKTKKSVNKFSALMGDDSDTDEDIEEKPAANTEDKDIEEKPAAKTEDEDIEEKPLVFDAGKRFDWADSDDE